MRLISRRVGTFILVTSMIATAILGVAPAAQAQDSEASIDPASRFFVDDSMTFSGLSSSSSFTLTPSPGESITEMHATFVATADTTDVLVDSFVDGHLTDSQKLAAAGTETIVLGLGEIVSAAHVTIRVTHVNEECRSDDTRLVELVDLEFGVDGLPLRPVGPQDFFPPHLSRVAVAMDQPGDAASQVAALNTMARLAARYRRDDFTIELVSMAELEFLNPDERAIIVDSDLDLLSEPQLSDFGPKVLRIHPIAGVDHLTSMLELATPPTQDSDIYVRVGDLTRDLSAQGITSSEVTISVPQTVFSRIPESYDVHLAGWTSMAHTSEFGAQVLTVTAGDTIVHTQTVTDSGPFDASFSVVEPPRDLDLRLTLRGPDIGEACKIETAAMEIAVDPLSSIAPVGQRSDAGFGSLPQGFAGAISIEADENAWSRAARLMALVQRTSATPLTVGDAGPTIAVRVTTDDEAVLTFHNDGLLLEGSLGAIDELLDQIAEESWYGLDGDIAQIGGTGLVTQFAETESVVKAGAAPEQIGAHTAPTVEEADATDASVDSSAHVEHTDEDGGEEATAAPDTESEEAEAVEQDESSETVSEADFTTPPSELAFNPVDTESKPVPVAALSGAAMLTLAGGIVVNRRDQLLGR